MKRQTKKYFFYYLVIICFFCSFLILVTGLSSILKSETRQLAESQKDKNSKEISKFLKYNGNFLRKYPDFLDCNNKIRKKWSSSSFYDDQQQTDYSKTASRANLNSRMLRGILVYFPINDSDKFMPEFKWLYRSWIELHKHEPTKWRTDFIVFTEEKAFNIFQDFNCSFNNIRKLETELPMCTLVKYIPVKNRNLILLSSAYNITEQKYEYLLNNIDIFSDNDFNLLPLMSLVKENLSKYSYLDSIMIAFEGYNYFKSAKYDYLLRTDMDTFLTPLFSKWLPKHCNDFVVGGGDYSAEFNVNRLKRVAEDLKLGFAGQWNLGRII